MKRKIVLAALLALAGGVATSWRWAAEWLYLAGIGAAATLTFSAGDSTSVPVTLPRNLILIPARVDDRQVNLILDSGLQFTVLNADRAAELRLPLHGERQVPGGGPGHRLTVAFARSATIAIGDARFRPRRLAAIPLSFLEPFIGERIDGIIGHDLLAQARVRIDYARRTVTLSRGSSAPLSTGGTALPVRIEGREAIVDVTLFPLSGDSVVAALKVDTGSPTALGVDGGLVRSTRLAGSNQARREVPGIGLAGESRGEAFLLRGVRVGDAVFETPLVYSTPTDSTTTGGVIGAELLRQFTLTFDYANARLWLQPAAGGSRSLDYDRSGLLLVAAGRAFDSLVVRHVESRSPAAQAGVLPGDVIVRVDSIGAEALRLTGVISALMHGGVTTTLGVVRAGRSMALTIRLPEHYPSHPGPP